MADTKLSALTNLAAAPAATDEFYINDGGASKAVTTPYVQQYKKGMKFFWMYVRFQNDGGTLKHHIKSGSVDNCYVCWRESEEWYTCVGIRYCRPCIITD